MQVASSTSEHTQTPDEEEISSLLHDMLLAGLESRNIHFDQQKIAVFIKGNRVFVRCSLRACPIVTGTDHRIEHLIRSIVIFMRNDTSVEVKIDTYPAVGNIREVVTIQ